MNSDSRLLLSIYDSALNSDSWTSALDNVTPLIGGKGVALLSVDLEGRYNFNANYLNSFYDQDRIALYKQDYAIHEQPVYADVLSQEPYRIRYDPQSLSDRDAFEQRPDVVWLREQFDVL